MSEKWVFQKTEPPETYYDFGPAIGQPGQFGEAFLITDKESKEVRAVKVVSKNKFRAEADRQFHFRQLRDEIKIMKNMKHRNIIQLYEVFESTSNLYMVMECCHGGELFDRIKEQPSGSFSEKDAAGVLRQIITGIQYMHKCRIAHCDLKPDNFLFLDKTAGSDLKIIDFGMSKLVQPKKYMSSFRGTPYYVAPEVLDGKYSEHCDIWSFGVVMFVMLFGYPPFHANSDEDIFRKIKKGFTSETKDGYGAWFPKAIACSNDAKDLISKCLRQNTADRLTADEVLGHAFFKGERSSEPLALDVVANLKKFTGKQEFKTKVLGMMSSTFSDMDGIKNLKQTFKELDTNGDGQLTPAELMQGFNNTNSNMSLDVLQELMKSADVDGDGCLCYEELMLATVNRYLVAKDERLFQSFCKLDVDLDGEITAQEVSTILGLTMEESVALIAEIDVNKDGKITYDEFSMMWMDKDNSTRTEFDKIR